MIFRCHIYQKEREKEGEKNGEVYRYMFMPLYGIINTLHISSDFSSGPFVKRFFWKQMTIVSFLYNALCNCISESSYNYVRRTLLGRYRVPNK